MMLTYDDHFVARLLEKVDQYEDMEKCWTWKTPIKGDYPQIWYPPKMCKAHRKFFEYLHGVIPEEAELHHKCENKKCINPCHLEVKKKEDHLAYHNMTRPRTEKCCRGHLMTEENTYVWIKRSGFEDRRCRECHKLHQKQYLERKRDA
jgi:HNH endonuclease